MSRCAALKLVWMLVCLLCLSVGAWGQPDVKPRLKIGLALAGGSALGEAHVGVLEWLEAHHIPVDYISGTSMGGLVGGCYATGMSPAEMHALLRSLNWTDLMLGEVSYSDLTFRQKEDRKKVPTGLTVGLRTGVNLPSGLTPANSINMLLSRISLPYSSLASFDDLPTPFRCMAIDLGSGKAVVLKDGPLDSALRSTMAIPAVFTPGKRNGRQLVDGAVLNNIPTEALKAMGPDIIIAVDLSSSFGGQSHLKSLIEVLGDTAAIAVYDNERRSLQLADIVLNPDLTGLSQTDFARVDEFTARGQQAAQAKSTLLSRLAVSDAEWQAYQEQRRARRRSAALTPTAIEVTGLPAKEAQRLQQRLKPFVGVPLQSDRLEKTLTAITGEGRYESFQYEQMRQGDGDSLLIRANPKAYGPPFLRFGLDINGSDSQDIQFNFASHLNAMDFGSPGAELWTDLHLGSDKQTLVEYYRPFAGTRWFLAPRLSYLDVNQQRYQNNSRVAIYGTRTAEAGLDVGYNTGRLSEMRLGYLFQHADSSVRTGDPGLASLHGNAGAFTFRWTYDGQDNPILPNRGTLVTLQSRWYFQAPGAVRSFPTAELQLNSFVPLAHGDSLFGIADIGTTFGRTPGLLQQFTLGGPFRLGAYRVEALRGNDSLLLSFGYLHQLTRLPPFLGDKIMIGGWYEFGGTSRRFDSAIYRSNLSVGLIANTLLGPVVVAGSYGEGGQNNVYFLVGRLF
jgi:NTE family protein